MSDYELQLKIKNARLLNVMRERGYNTAADLSRATGIAQNVIGEFLNLKSVAYASDTMKLRKPVEQLCDFLGVGVDEIFPPDNLYAPLMRNSFAAQVTTDELDRALTSENLDPAKILLEQSLNIDTMLDAAELTPLERRVIESRFIEEKTLREVGKEIDKGPERVRQIESKALRKIRRPNRLERIIEHAPPIGDDMHENSISPYLKRK